MAHTLQKKNPFWFYFVINILVALCSIDYIVQGFLCLDVFNAAVYGNDDVYKNFKIRIIVLLAVSFIVAIFSLVWIGLNFKFKSKQPIVFYVFLAYLTICNIVNIVFNRGVIHIEGGSNILVCLIFFIPIIIFTLLCIKLEKKWMRTCVIIFISITAGIMLIFDVINLISGVNYASDIIGLLQYVSTFLDINILLLLDIAIGISYRFKKVRPVQPQPQYVPQPVAQQQPQYVVQPVVQQPIAYVPVYANQVVPVAQQQVTPVVPQPVAPATPQQAEPVAQQQVEPVVQQNENQQ